MGVDRKATVGNANLGTPVGVVAAIWRYPVKSMAAESLDEVDLTWHGLTGDRRWAFVRDGVERSGFPWLTIRQRSDMCHYRPRFSNPLEPDKSPVVVRTPTGLEFDVVDPALAEELGHGARPIKQDRGVFDTFPVSLITTQTIFEIGAKVGAKLSPLRFRPNLLIEAADETPFPEDEWVGAVLTVGDASMRIDKRDKRCVVVNVDPATAESKPSILRTITTDREKCLGVYGTTVQPGRVAVGDSVLLLSRQ
ncbi:MAG: MOSC domain-containing protein [Rhodothermia bacterium]|nr:MOSC domain-containing protein [Rhodothermia bacterium]